MSGQPRCGLWAVQLLEGSKALRGLATDATASQRLGVLDMALTVKKSMDIGTFADDWAHITALVEAEHRAVEGMGGYYSLELELIW